MLGLFFVLYFIELSVCNSLRTSSLSYLRILQHNSIAKRLFTGQLVMAFSQNLLAVQTPYPVVRSNYVPGLRLEFTRFYGETGHFKLNFSVGNSNFSQFFVSGIHIHTFFHNSAEKKFRFIGTLKLLFFLYELRKH